MQPVNPFLRAFFRSALLGQCLPVNHHILLVPTTDCLLHGRDSETKLPYAELAGTEDFLASHVIRIPGGQPPGTKEGSNVRESKTKAKQYTTINARTVVIKDTFVYSNKGFKSLNQAQLLNETIYYPESPDNQQWLVYFISRPLIGTFEPVAIIPAILKSRAERDEEDAKRAGTEALEHGQGSVMKSKKKDVKSFSDLMGDFPMIARHMQHGLDKIFKEFCEQFERPAHKRSSRPPSVRSQGSAASLEDSLATLKSSISDSETLRPSSSALDPEEETMRVALEHATTTAIDLFQNVDKQQLSMLGATTNLSGPAVERLIERYVAEQLHEKALFPRLCSIHREDDGELESRIRKMTDIDIAQVGITIEGGRAGKRKLAIRMDEGVAVFKKQGVASSPQDMIDILLSTEKVLATGSNNKANNDNESEKQALAMTMNADTLVSMLLVVVIRSGVRHMNARLSYMRNFVFIDEVETGEIGYAISTFEAVLAYLATDSEPLRRASRRNTQLWQAAKDGDVAKLRATLEPDRFWPEEYSIEEEHGRGDSSISDLDMHENQGESSRRPSRAATHRSSSSGEGFAAVDGSLAHVFPFQKPPTPPPEIETRRPKRVSMASFRSDSVSSGYSSRGHSRRESTNSATSNTVAADTTLDKLAQTQNINGESMLMMAVDSGQEAAMRYLLNLEDLFPLASVLDDCSNEGATLLSNAVQSGHERLTHVLLDFVIEKAPTDGMIRDYLARQDSKGRCVAHYLFDQPRLMDDIGHLLPWTLKDKNGQTPLFALCRSYDHAQYHSMVLKALELARHAQDDDEALHLDQHIDAKGNTLLHIVHDPQITSQLLKHADVDVNASNDKKFTPFMVASKYGKIDLVRVLFNDARIEMQRRDLRGLTAVELAKDDEIRNRIDDMVLLASPPSTDGRITTIVRSFFVEDATVRLILKSGGPNPDGTITVTTCRRSLVEFENLAKWLSIEQPASWLPIHFNLQSPFMIPSKPSRSVLRDIQLRMDNFLRNLLTHATFGTHELVWEFFLVPDIDPIMLSERSKRKAEIRVENVRDEYEPITDTHEVELFVKHAQEQVRRLSSSHKTLIRRTNAQRQIISDMSDLQIYASTALNTLTFLPQAHETAMSLYTKALASTETSPLAGLYYNLQSITSTTSALLSALQRPSHLISSMEQSRRTIDRQISSLTRQSRWTPNLTFFDDTRRAIQEEAQAKTDKARRELEGLGCELRYTQQTVAAELAGWQEEHVKVGRRMIKDFAKGVVVRERERLEGMRRALRELRK